MSKLTITLTQLKDAFFIALSSLMRNKLRSILTLLGVVIGVMVVVAMLSIIEGLNKSMAEDIGAIGTNVIYIMKDPAVSFGPRDPEIRKRKPITEEDAEAIKELCPSISVAAPEVWNYADVKYESESTGGMVIMGATVHYLQLNDIEVEYGRNFTEQDMLSATRTVFLGYDVVEQLFPAVDPIGKDIRIGGHRFTVIGTGKEKGEFLGNSRDEYVLIPVSTFEKTLGTHRRYEELHIIAQAKSEELIPKALDEIEYVMRQRRGVSPDEENDFEMMTQDSLMDIYNQITGAAFAIMVGISAISLLIGGIGIMNIMLVSVTERTREIGVRKAIGAKRRDILWQFLIESASLSIVGGLLGIIIGIIIALLVGWLSPLPSAIAVWSIFLGFTFATATGLFFGIYPAAKAARLDPIKALHYE